MVFPLHIGSIGVYFHYLSYLTLIHYQLYYRYICFLSAFGSFPEILSLTMIFACFLAAVFMANFIFLKAAADFQPAY